MKTLFAIAATVAVASGDSGRPTKEQYEKGKADEAKAAEAKANRDKKLAAVNKVITMLEDLSVQVVAEGEKEAASYNKFACFCKDTTKEKTEAIKKGTDEQTSLSTRIGVLSVKREKLDKLIKQLTKKG